MDSNEKITALEPSIKRLFFAQAVLSILIVIMAGISSFADSKVNNFAYNLILSASGSDNVLINKINVDGAARDIALYTNFGIVGTTESLLANVSNIGPSKEAQYLDLLSKRDQLIAKAITPAEFQKHLLDYLAWESSNLTTIQRDRAKQYNDSLKKGTPWVFWAEITFNLEMVLAICSLLIALFLGYKSIQQR